MAELDTASTTGAKHSVNIRRRNVQNAETTSTVATQYTTDDDEKKMKAKV